MASADTATLTCSWSDARLDDRTVHLRFEEGGMGEAEGFVMAALDTHPDPSSRTALADTATAPWLNLAVGRSGVVALCLVVNARILEIHEAADASTPLLTQEAQLTSSTTGLHAHFLCHGSGGALFPPGHAYRLKLFGRSPREEVVVARVCVVELAAPPAETPPASVTAEAALTNSDVAAFIFALQRQLVAMEGRMDAALDGVTHRLSRLESRVDRLEAPKPKAEEETMGAAEADALSSQGEDAQEARDV